MNDRMQQALREWAEAHGWFVDDDEYVDLAAHLKRAGFVSVEDVAKDLIDPYIENHVLGGVEKALLQHIKGRIRALTKERP